MPYLTNTVARRIQWGECDPAGIVFYPRYFEWFDACTILLFEKATGMTKIEMLAKYNGAGLALLEARAEFKVASHYGEDIAIATAITEFRDADGRLRLTTPLAVNGVNVLVVTPAGR